MIAARDTELGSEVKLTPPDEVQTVHLQHLPHPHSGFSNSSIDQMTNDVALALREKIAAGMEFSSRKPPLS